jgi:hypothetical protein
MIAAFAENDRRHIIGPGVTTVAVSRRVGSYDHIMHVAARERGWDHFFFGDRGLQHHAGRWRRGVGASALVANRQEVGDAAAAARRGATRDHS